MRSLLLIFLVFGLFSCKQTQPVIKNMRYDVDVLAHDSLYGRKTGSQHERKAAEYISNRFKELWLQPKGEDGFFQKFVFKSSANPHQEAEFVSEVGDNVWTGHNVLGFLDNHAKYTVVIGAHYDHLGMGGSGSLHRDEPAIHNGADDNASGVAMMLKLAKQLQEKDAPKSNNYLFIAFSGEEEGLLGSNYFVKNPTVNLQEMTYMINMDMVGRLNEEKTLAVHGVGTSPRFKEIVRANAGNLKIVENESGVGPSDHTSFYLADIPVLHFFTGQHEDYHRPTDDIEKMNFEGMNIVSRYIYHIIKDLDAPEKLIFQRTKNESKVVPDFKVTLGVVSDYLFDGKGMRIDGVSEDRPAHKAGLQKGDVVLKMGDYEIEDMMGYMKALSKFEKGETTTLVFRRDAEEQKVSITF